MDEDDHTDEKLDTTDSTVVELLRTVTPPYVSRPNTEMDVFGWSYLLVMAIILVPFLPFILLAWLFSKGLEAVAAARGE